MPLMSKTVEVDADAEVIMSIVSDFEAYPQWNPEIKGSWILARYDHFSKQEQRFSVVPIGATSLLTVDLEVETKLSIPGPMVKKAIGETLDHLANSLVARVQWLAGA